MKLYFATEARFVKRGNNYYSLGGFSYKLWERYLNHFHEMIIIARVSTDESIPVDESMLASHKNVKFIELPYYVGFKGYIFNRKHIYRIINDQISNDGCYICRLPGQIGGILISVLKSKKIQYACEIVGNPWDVFAKGSVNHPLRPIIRRLAKYRLKKQVKHSSACLYVTKKTLQLLYPANKKAFTIGVSDVIVNKNSFAKKPKYLKRNGIISLISVGSLEQMYKAPDVVLEAMSVLKQRGIEVHLTWLGDGAYKNDMINMSIEKGLDADFKGNVSVDMVHYYLDQSDIFLLVSRTEGLPRAIIEAMAHGLPCIGTRVGGIPELLDEDVLVEKEEPMQLANLLEKMIKDIDFTNQQAERNLKEADSYKEDKLEKLRNKFFEYIISNYNKVHKTL